jgi:hypothetical protein
MRFIFSFSIATSLAVVLLILPGATNSGDLLRYHKLKEHTLISSCDHFWNPFHDPGLPWKMASSPGDTLGWTLNEQQTVGSAGRRVAVDGDEGVHACWQGTTSDPDESGVYFEYRDPMRNWHWPGGLLIAGNAGHPQLAIDSEDSVYVAFHCQTSYITFCKIDPQTGDVQWYDPPDMLHYRCFWPYMTIDRNDNAHIVMCEDSPYVFRTLGYTRSTDAGENWSRLARVDTVTTISQVIVASPVSDKVSIIYAHPTDLTSQWMNDVYFIESEDGYNWDWQGAKVNITEYGEDGDSLYAYTDLDAVYDFNDALHIVWNAQWVTEERIYVRTFLFHWSVESEMTTEICSSDSVWIEGCDFGAWNRPICKMSLSINEATNYLAIIYTKFDSSDCSSGGYANGDIFMQYSIDEGESWSQPIGITNSRTPDCEPGDCDSDHWGTMADRFELGWPYPDPYLIYINDKDAGCYSNGEGDITSNPVMFLDYVPTGIDNEEIMPRDFLLVQNYPNPFNARTTIMFSLAEAANIKLRIFDIAGRLVEVLADGEYPAGENSVVWDAKDQASGIYFVRLAVNAGAEVRKTVLLK